jgi:hypothetical protein
MIAQLEAAFEPDHAQTPRREKKNRTLAGPVQFVGAGADITFQRGTTADNCGRDLGGWATGCRQQLEQYDESCERENTASRMPAMRALQSKYLKILGGG